MFSTFCGVLHTEQVAAVPRLMTVQPLCTCVLYVCRYRMCQHQGQRTGVEHARGHGGFQRDTAAKRKYDTEALTALGCCARATTRRRDNESRTCTSMSVVPMVPEHRVRWVHARPCGSIAPPFASSRVHYRGTPHHPLPHPSAPRDPHNRSDNPSPSPSCKPHVRREQAARL